MALLDLFRPKWKHSNIKIREKAIEEISDQIVLLSIARSEKDIDLRYKALGKITNQTLLVNLARIDKDLLFRIFAIEHIIDNIALYELALIEDDVCKYAIKQINNLDLLNKLLESKLRWHNKKEVLKSLTGIDVFSYTLHEIKNDALLIIIAKEADDSYIRKAALNCIADENEFANLIISNPNEFGSNEKEIFEKIKDKALLASVLKLTISSFSYYFLKENLNFCPFCNSSNLFWDEWKYTKSESGPADSFYRETETYKSEESKYKLICNNCNTELAKGDTGDY